MVAMKLILACLLISLVLGDVHVLVGPQRTPRFSPSAVTINVGDTVTWFWQGNNHNVISGRDCEQDVAGPLNSGATSDAGHIYSYTFAAAGDYPYFCGPHCSFGMIGVVHVVDPDDGN